MKNNWKLILLSLLTGIVSGIIAAKTFSIGNIPDGPDANWFQIVAPGLAFGFLTFWFSFCGQNYKLLKSLIWIVVCPITFYTSYILAINGSSASFYDSQLSLIVAGFVGASILLIVSHFLFSKSSFKYKLIVAVVAGIISPIIFFNQYLLFIVWQTFMAIIIGFSLIKYNRV